MTRGYLNIPDGQIHYQSQGTGRPVLLLHRSPMSSEEYDGIVPLLAKTHRAVALDSMGHGNSSDPPREYEIEDYARSSVQVLDGLGITKTCVVGHHTGALIAVEIAAAYPDRVEKLILSGCSMYTPEQWKTMTAGKRLQSRDIPMTADGAFLMKTWEIWRAKTPDSPPETTFKPFIIALRARTRPRDAHAAAFRYRVAARLGLIKCPTLLMSGTKDQFYDQLQMGRALIRNCVTAELPGGGSSMLIEKPAEFARIVLDFLG